jgi:hypothetical protein
MSCPTTACRVSTSGGLPPSNSEAKRILETLGRRTLLHGPEIGSLSTAVLALIFAAAAVARWIVAIGVAKTTDGLDRALGLGDAPGG